MIPKNTLCYTKANIGCRSDAGQVVTVVGHIYGCNKIKPPVICLSCNAPCHLAYDDELIPINPLGVLKDEPAVVVKPRTKKEKVTS